MKINLLLIALKNLNRHKVKTFLTVLSIVVGTFLYIFMDAWLLGMKQDSLKNVVNFESGSVIIYSKKFYEKKDEIPTYELFYNSNEIKALLEKNGYYGAERVEFSGSLISEQSEIPFVFTGINIESEQKVLDYHKYLKAGEYLEEGKFEILLGERGARKLGVNVGDFVKLSTIIDKYDENGNLKHISQVFDLKIKGLIFSPNPKTNGFIGYISLSVLQDESGLMLENGINKILVNKIDRNPNSLPLKNNENKKIEKILGDLVNESNLKIINWFEDIPDFFAAYSGDFVSTNIMIGILFLLSFLGIANTMLMATLQRTKEIGMMKALGITDFEVKKIFLYEAFWLGLIGAFFGVLLGIITNFYMVNIGVDYTNILDSLGTNYGYRVIGHLKSSWNFITIFFVLVLTPILSMGVSYISINRQTKINIVEALRFE